MTRLLKATASFAAVISSAYALSFIHPLASGAAAGGGLVSWTTWLLWPWRSLESSNAMKRMVVGFMIRFACLFLIAIWGFMKSFSAGLTGILVFGLGFIALTYFEYQDSFKS